MKSKLNFGGAFALLLLLTSILCFYTIRNANWLMGDDWMFVTSTAIGKPFPISENLRPADGRFCPLAQQHNNLLLLLEPDGVSIETMYIRNAMELCAFSILMFLFLWCVLKRQFRCSGWHPWIALLTAIVLIERVLNKYFLSISYGGGFFPLLVLLFLWTIWHFHISQKQGYGIMSLLSAIYLTYMFEPAFGVFVVFAIVPLVFDWHNLSAKMKWYYGTFLLNGVVFAILYYFLIYRHMVAMYHPNSVDNVTIWSCFKMCMLSQKMFLLAVPLAIVRLYALFVQKDRAHILYDALLFAGVAGIMANCILKLNTGHYYVFPLLLVALPTMYFLVYYFKEVVTFLLVGLLGVFYLSKIPKDIRSNQTVRLYDFPIVRVLSSEIKNGVSVCVYQPADEYVALQHWDKVFCDYYYMVLENMLRMDIHDANYCFKYISDSSDISPEDVLLVSDYLKSAVCSCGRVQADYVLSNINIYMPEE